MATFLDHLAELRRRLLACAAAVAIGTAVAQYYNAEILAILLRPVQGTELVFLSPLDPLLFLFKIDLAAGFVAALPVIGWNALSFLKPAVNGRHWLRFSIIFVVAAVLMLAGLAYSYLVTVPISLAFLTSIEIAGIGNLITASSYLSFLLVQLVLMAVLFQLPLFILAGVSIGVFSVEALATKRRHAYAAGLIALAILTPTTDFVTLGVVALPAAAIFELSLLVARFLPRRTLGLRPV